MKRKEEKVNGADKSKHPLYSTWLGMKERCKNPGHKDYMRYGGRGIKVCDEWRESFIAFLNYMGSRPPKHTLDRIEVNGNYEPGNVRWANHKAQARNTSRNRPVTWNGETKCLSAWSEELGIHITTLWSRLSKTGELFPKTSRRHKQLKAEKTNGNNGLLPEQYVPKGKPDQDLGRN